MHIDDAIDVLDELDVAHFSMNKEKVAAVAWHGVVIGEAAKRALQSGCHIDDPALVHLLERVRTARNQFAHEYDTLEPDNLYVTVTNLYVPLRATAAAYLTMPPP